MRAHDDGAGGEGPCVGTGENTEHISGASGHQVHLSWTLRFTAALQRSELAEPCLESLQLGFEALGEAAAELVEEGFDFERFRRPSLRIDS